MSVGAARSLGEALRTFGGKACRGGAVGIDPNNKEAAEYRRLIRLYNRTQQMREQGGFGGADERFEASADGREEELGAVFAAKTQNGQSGREAPEGLRTVEAAE